MIDTSQWYIIADFRETELPSIRPGDQVTGYVITEPVRIFGLGRERGVRGRRSGRSGDRGRSAGPARPELDPDRPAVSGRIALEGPPSELMRIGASAVVVVRHGRGEQR